MGAQARDHEGGPARPAAAARPGGGGRSDAGREVLQGSIDSVVFHAADTLYTVLKVDPEAGYDDPGAATLFRARRLAAVGPMVEPAEGLRVRLTGRWTDHRTHGRQFEFHTVETLPPNDTAGLVAYLASKAFPGIGETLAERIVSKLGAEALERIREDPGVLAGVPGLRAAVARDLAERVRRRAGSHRAQTFLRGLGLGPVQAAQVESALGAKTEETLKRDPYVLARTVPGFGFVSADRIASGLGLPADGPERCRAALLHVLREASGDGHSLMPEGELLDAAGELLRGQAPRERLAEAVAELARLREVVLEDAPASTGAGAEPDAGGEAPGRDAGARRVYLPQLAASERGLAGNLAHLLAAAPVPAWATAEQLDQAQRRARIELHPVQREAVLGLCSHPVALLTGGPGVGKTTIVRLVADLAERAGRRCRFASPTGRAAKRLSEATGREAATIHRLLGFEPGTGGFVHDDRAPIEADLVVVDEISMLDVALAHHLVKAVQPPTRLVLVGDPDQLPSVGAGNVLRDLLDSRVVPTWRLTEIFRQRGDSLIVENAHRILRGELPAFPPRGDHDADFYLFPAEDPTVCAERVVEVVTRRIPERFGLDWVEDVQVLAPMYRGPCGVDALNERLREALGTGGREVRLGERTWRLGDRVIHTRNDYDKEVFNGDMGRISEVHEDGSLVVRYPDRSVPYDRKSLTDLQPAFAITVHRSQGGEYPAVVMPLVTQHFVMLQRNLLYTAVTRARRLVVLVGSQRALQTAVDNAQENRRQSALAERLRAAVAS